MWSWFGFCCFLVTRWFRCASNGGDFILGREHPKRIQVKSINGSYDVFIKRLEEKLDILGNNNEYLALKFMQSSIENSQNFDLIKYILKGNVADYNEFICNVNSIGLAHPMLLKLSSGVSVLSNKDKTDVFNN